MRTNSTRGKGGPGSMSGARRKGRSSCTNGVAHDSAVDWATNPAPRNLVKGRVRGSAGFYRVSTGLVRGSAAGFVQLSSGLSHRGGVMKNVVFTRGIGAAMVVLAVLGGPAAA